MIKKRLTIPLTIDGEEQEVTVDVNFRIIEIVESVFDMNADWVASKVLVSPKLVKYSKVADTIADWIGPMVEHRRGKIREAVLQSSPKRLGTYIGCIQAACLYFRNLINPEQFDKLSRGEDIEEEDEKKSEPLTSSTGSSSESSESPQVSSG